MARIWPSVQMEQHTLSPTCDETEKVRVQEWIRSNIRRKDCIRYENPAGNNSDPMAPCYCNYKKSDHSYEVQSKTDDKSTWNSKSHIQASPTNAFGEIKFSDNESKNCKYVRLDVETEKEKTLTLLTGMWNLPKPNLLISITTRAEPFKVKPRLQNIFQRDLMKAIQMTGAWIITDGARRGITQLVGKTARDQELTTTNRERRVVAIGVAAWRDISDKEELIDDKLCGKWPAKYSAGDLDPNHSYFMLADDGAYKRGSDISFRTALGKAVSDMKTDNGTDAGHIPHVLIAADGGIETLETIQRSLKNETPTVVVKGSGRAAEIIAFAAQKCRRESVVGNDEKGRYQLVTRGVIDDKLEAEIKELMDKEYQDMKDRETVDEQFMFVKECLQRLDLLVIFDISSKESSDEIDTAILKALFKDKIQPARKLLDLALAFNNVDLAKSDIFTSGKFLSYRDLDAVMKSALEMNRASFVEVLLDHVNLDLFLTAEILVQLYNTLSPKSLLYGMLDKYRGKKKYVSLKDVGDLLKSMIPNFEHYYLTDKNIHSLDITKIMEPRPEDPDEDSDMRPCEDLFLWSVLAGYHDIADVFWRQGQDTLVAAVVGNHLMKAMMDKAPDGELKAKYEAKALEYEKLSVGILQELYTADEEKTQQLLISPLKNWGNTSIVAIALHADNKKFISQAACQSLLTQIWRGKVKTEDNHLVRKSLPSNTTETTSPGKFQIIPKYLINVKERVKRYEFVDFLQAPVGIFVMNVVSFLIFLLLYSYVLLFEMKQKKITVGEILLIIWVLTLFLEEIRQIYAAHNIKSERIKNYIHNWWNVIDMVILGKFVVGLILRSVDNFEVYSAGRFVLAINVLTFFLRILHIFSIHKELGPKLVMIQKMVILAPAYIKPTGMGVN